MLAFSAAPSFSFIGFDNNVIQPQWLCHTQDGRIPRAVSWVHLIDLYSILLTDHFYSKARQQGSYTIASCMALDPALAGLKDFDLLLYEIFMFMLAVALVFCLGLAQLT